MLNRGVNKVLLILLKCFYLSTTLTIMAQRGLWLSGPFPMNMHNVNKMKVCSLVSLRDQRGLSQRLMEHINIYTTYSLNKAPCCMWLDQNSSNRVKVSLWAVCFDYMSSQNSEYMLQTCIAGGKGFDSQFVAGSGWRDLLGGKTRRASESHKDNRKDILRKKRVEPSWGWSVFLLLYYWVSSQRDTLLL